MADSIKKDHVILISEDEYSGLIETLYLSQNKEYKESLIEGLKEDINLGIEEDSNLWNNIDE
ncbi:hypothetical protein BN85400550 [Alteracholeplasma palmae J233]|uniref:Antitoxin n=1 Tax=Alteracholeplasma palmae (strain ATCC 49389 / J233) TaxID=1318466 RepID=U4KJN8_ALTPJ|nr:hypothetical protein [Alteracholeplasma palmae]CCV63632.1 hypothetical protein BN85400550 [Alteracholeplasma palmae J233]